ncbi:MAG TPA: ATP synthase subunit I [Bacillota bacterium]|nr:ATP synthase subunit I [Bacillota bacterium]
MRDWDFEGQIARTLRICGYLLAFLCLFLVLRPQDSIVRGFALGTAVGMWNAFFLTKRINKTRQLTVAETQAQIMTGLAMRLLTVFAVLFFVARTVWFNIYATAAGLFVVPCIFTFGVVGMIIREAREAKSLKL